MTASKAHAGASRFLAPVLQHKPEAAGIVLDEHGWADVDKLVAGIAAMHRDGYEFFLSENGVWLTKHVPSRYLALLGE